MGRTQLDFLATREEAEALGVAGVADGDVHRTAGVHREVVHRRAALVRVHVPCQVPACFSSQELSEQKSCLREVMLSCST